MITKNTFKKFHVIHEYWGHDDRDGLTPQGHWVMQTDDAVEAFAAALQYERDHEVGRYFEDGQVLVRSEGKAWSSGGLHRYLETLKFGPVYRDPSEWDQSRDDWMPF
jgi:hypothetical protein